ncbi:MAG: hypothetical protein ACMUJM_05240 [bacterium]
MCKRKHVIVIITLSVIVSFAASGTLMAQNWQALPPYNILWPLFSPSLSPPDPVTGAPTPLLNELASDTILPVQPVMGWNPNSYSWPMSITMPWLFYNGPTGVVFFDALYGLNPWPPQTFLDPAGAPIPITLPPDYTFSPLPDLKETQYLIPLANQFYLTVYGVPLGINPTSLLTFADIWGTPIFFAGGIP